MLERRKRASLRAGSAMVEFALVTPLIVGLLLGVMAYGYDFYTYARLEDAVRGAARYATGASQTYDVNAGHDPDLSCGAATTCMVQLDSSTSLLARRTANFAVYGTPNPGGDAAPLIPGLTTANIVVSVEVLNNRPKNIWVAVNGFRLMTPTGSINLANKPAAVFPWFGNYTLAP